MLLSTNCTVDSAGLFFNHQPQLHNSTQILACSSQNGVSIDTDPNIDLCSTPQQHINMDVCLQKVCLASTDNSCNIQFFTEDDNLEKITSNCNKVPGDETQPHPQYIMQIGGNQSPPQIFQITTLKDPQDINILTTSDDQQINETPCQIVQNTNGKFHPV